jgi:hypothetical protein
MYAVNSGDAVNSGEADDEQGEGGVGIIVNYFMRLSIIIIVAGLIRLESLSYERPEQRAAWES